MVVPGSAVVIGSDVGEVAKVIAWDFEVSDDDPIVTLEVVRSRRAPWRALSRAGPRPAT